MSDRAEDGKGRTAGAGAPATPPRRAGDGGAEGGRGGAGDGRGADAGSAGASRLPRLGRTIGVGVGAPPVLPAPEPPATQQTAAPLEPTAPPPPPHRARRPLPSRAQRLTAREERAQNPVVEPAPQNPVPRLIEGEVTARSSQRLDPTAGAAQDDGVEHLPPKVAPDVRRSLLAHLRAISNGEAPFGPLQLPPRGKAAATKQPMTTPKSSTSPAPRPGLAPGQDDGRWPSGPLISRDLFSRAEVETLIEAILTDVEIMEHPTYPGLSRNRLRLVAKQAGFEPIRFGRFSAYLLIWFARAGVTLKASDRWRGEWDGPRPLSTEEKSEVRLMLVRVPPPTKRDVDVIRTQNFDDSTL